MAAKERFTVEELDQLVEINFAVAPTAEFAARYGYIRQIVADSKESLHILATICDASKKYEAAYGAFVSGIIMGLLLAETRK
jgi:hypothetical protein